MQLAASRLARADERSNATSSDRRSASSRSRRSLHSNYGRSALPQSLVPPRRITLDWVSIMTLTVTLVPK